MTTPESGLLPDTPIEAITITRIAEILEDQELQYRIEDAPAPTPAGENASDADEAAPATIQLLRTGFVNTIIAMQLRNDNLVIDSVWRGQVPVSEGPQLLSLINQWNSEHFAPTLRFFESDQGSLAVSAVRELHAVHGASRNQLGAFVMASLNALLEAFAFIEAAYPQLVTWQEPVHD